MEKFAKNFITYLFVHVCDVRDFFQTQYCYYKLIAVPRGVL